MALKFGNIPPVDKELQVALADAGKMNRDVTLETNKHKFENGATSSVQQLFYHLIPATFIRRLAERFTVGAKKHGAYNYTKGIHDQQWFLDRINHVEEHWQLFKSGNVTDDNLGAIGWGIAVLCEAQEVSPQMFANTMQLFREKQYPKQNA